MSRKNVLIAIGVVLVGRAPSSARTCISRRTRGSPVTTDVIKARDLEAVVSASGKIQPKRLVKISAETPGRVVNLAVNEGDRVKKRPVPAADRPEVAAARASRAAPRRCRRPQASIEQMRQSVETARGAAAAGAAEPDAPAGSVEAAADHARGAREGGERRQGRRVGRAGAREADHAAGEPHQRRRRRRLESARYDLSKVRMESPIDGIVTRRNVQEGETAVIGTMNNAGTVLLELADMAVIQAEVEVDETNIPNVQIGQPAKITIDAIPDETFKGHVSEIGNSPIQAAARPRPARRRPTSRSSVILDEQVPDVRPGFTCTADITTATRKDVVAVPIPAVAVRELVYDANGQVVKEPQDRQEAPRRAGQPRRPCRRPSSSRARRARKPKACSSCATARPNSCRSRWASPATSTSKCCRASRPATR